MCEIISSDDTTPQHLAFYSSGHRGRIAAYYGREERDAELPAMRA